MPPPAPIGSLYSRLKTQIEKLRNKGDEKLEEKHENLTKEEIMQQYRDEQIGKATTRFDNIGAKIKELDEKALETIDAKDESVYGYVTFASQVDRAKILRKYKQFYCSQPQDMRLLGKKLSVSPAPAPSTLVWENNEITAASRSARSFLSLLVLLVVLIVSASISYLADEEKAFKTLTDFGADLQPEQVCNGVYANVDLSVAIEIATNTSDR